VVYTDRRDWLGEAISFLPTIAIMGFIFWMTRKMGDRMGGGSGGRNMFSVGKASVTQLDQQVLLSRPNSRFVRVSTSVPPRRAAQ
jgi:ATP-dependent Zn protease